MNSKNAKAIVNAALKAAAKSKKEKIIAAGRVRREEPGCSVPVVVKKTIKRPTSSKP